MAKQFTLGKTERLKSRKQIEQLFSEGKKISVGSFRIFYLFINSSAGGKSSLSFGVAVPVRSFKKAVDRNRIKRLVKEAWRLQKDDLAKMLKARSKHLNVFFIYTGKELPDQVFVKDKLAVALKKLENITDENVATDP